MFFDAIRLWGSSRQAAARTEVARLATVAGEAKQLAWCNLDVIAWQAWYILDDYAKGAKTAVDPSSTSRKGYLDAVQSLKGVLDGVHEQWMTPERQAIMADVRKQWQQVFATDDRIVAALSKDSPTSAAEAVKILNTDSEATFG
jgi:methyl-accepting chemotaxis protein